MARVQHVDTRRTLAAAVRALDGRLLHGGGAERDPATRQKTAAEVRDRIAELTRSRDELYVAGAAANLGEERRLHPAGMLLAALGAIRRWIGLATVPGIAALFNGGLGVRTLVFVLLGVALLGVSAV